MVALVEKVEVEMGPIDCCVYNIGGPSTFVQKGFLETTVSDFQSLLEMISIGGFITGQAVARKIVSRGHGHNLHWGDCEPQGQR